MCLLFETIRISDGKLQHLHWHKERMERSVAGIFGLKTGFSFPEIHVPEDFSHGLVKCKVVYDTEVREIRFVQYNRREIRSFRLIISDDIDYSFKFSERKRLDDLYEMRGNCDEILIVKNGLVTDTSYSNIIFFDGDKWITPLNPLLKGTCRERLISEGKLEEAEIRPGDLHRFSGCKIINAMNWPEENILIKTENIIF